MNQFKIQNHFCLGSSLDIEAMAGLKQFDDRNLKAASAASGAYRDVSEQALWKMNAEELRLAWIESSDPAEMAEILAYMEIACQEEDISCPADVGFRGETSGGGGGSKELHALSSKICYESQCLASGGTMLKSAQKRELTDTEKEAGRTQSGIAQPPGAKVTRRLTDAEMSQGKLLVQAVYNADEFAAHEMGLAELKATRAKLKLEIYEIYA